MMANDKPICFVSGCDKPSRAAGLCAAHRRHQKLCGNPVASAPPKKAKTIAWVEQAVKSETDDCLIWPFAVGAGGYGNLSNEGRHVNAHRLTLILSSGEAPNNRQAAHSCGNKLCCNPRHLRWATPAENNKDKIAHGTLMRGNAVPSSKLTPDDVRRIRNRKNCLLDELAEDFGISKQQVSKIMRREAWSWVE